MSTVPSTLGAIARTTARRGACSVRVAIVIACAGALIMAGQALPV